MTEHDAYIQELEQLYKRLARRDKSAKYVKADLHIHTPASKGCYVFGHPKMDEESEYKLLINSMGTSDVHVFAITDHNTLNGYYKIQELLDVNHDLKAYMNKKCILPGVEITCYGKHFLVIFPENVTKDRTDTFLLRCGIGPEEQGMETASADNVSPLMLCTLVEEYGGFIIVAHADEDKGLLQTYIKKNSDDLSVDIQGNSIIKVLKSKVVLGICYNSNFNLQKLKTLLKEWKLEGIALLQASDCHSSSNASDAPGVFIGSRCSYVKLGVGEMTFRSLRLRLMNHLQGVKNITPNKMANLNILGMCIRGGFLRDTESNNEWATIPFSPELNCVIGARGTGKTTLMSFLQLLLNKGDKEIQTDILNREDRFDVAIVFLQREERIFATVMKTKSTSRILVAHFERTNGGFKRLKNTRGYQRKEALYHNDFNIFAINENIQSYTQKKIMDLGKSTEGITEIIDFLTALYRPAELRSAVKTFVELRGEITDEVERIIKARKRPTTYIQTTPGLEEKFKQYSKANQKINSLRKETVGYINNLMRGKLQLVDRLACKTDANDYNIIEKWIEYYRWKENIPYESMRDMRKIMNNVFKTPKTSWALPFWLFTGKTHNIIKEFSIPLEVVEEMKRGLAQIMQPHDVMLLPKIEVDFELNVNYPNYSKEKYKNRKHLSFGQRAVGVLLLVLHGATELGETRPLFIDQPEDDLDNTYIYHILVKEFLSIKEKRQVILATHNPNIPMAGQSENILVMDSDGHQGWVATTGSFGNQSISDRVMKILEGDFEAFRKRAEIYGFSLV